jgi:hypothetical protein
MKKPPAGAHPPPAENVHMTIAPESASNGKPGGWCRVENSAVERIAEVGLLPWAVYTVLCRYANSAGECWPSIPRIAVLCGCTDRAVQTALRTLTTAGLVRVSPRRAEKGQTTNAYTLPPINPVNVASPGEPSFTGGVNVASPAPVNVASPRTRPNRNKTHRKKEPDIDRLTWPPSLDATEAREALVQWLAYKRERGQAYKTTRGPQMILDEFVEYGPSALCAAVRRSIACNWAGLFAPDGKPRRQSEDDLPLLVPPR